MLPLLPGGSRSAITPHDPMRGQAMRAETQNIVEAIRKSLKLLGQRMDWETAPHRLGEFNAMI